MSGMEIILAAVLALSAVWGYKRGVVMQLGSLLAFVIAIVVCRLFGGLATDAVAAMMGCGAKETAEAAAGEPMTRLVASFVGHVALFVIVWAAIGLLARTVRLVARTICLGFIDNAAGALFMAFKTAVVLSFVINFARTVWPSCALAASNGPVSAPVAELAPWLLGFIQPLAQ